MQKLISKFSWATVYQALGMLGPLAVFILLVNNSTTAAVGEYTYFISVFALIFGLTDFSSSTYCLRQLSKDDLKYLKIFFLLRLSLVLIIGFLFQVIAPFSSYVLNFIFIMFILNFEYVGFYLKTYKIFCLARLILIGISVSVIIISETDQINIYILCWAVINFFPKLTMIFYPPALMVIRKVMSTRISINDINQRVSIHLGAAVNSFNSLVLNAGVWVLSGMFLTDTQIGTLSIYMKLKIPFQLVNIVVSAHAIPVLSKVSGDVDPFSTLHSFYSSLTQKIYILIFAFIILGIGFFASEIESVVGTLDYALIFLCLMVNLPVPLSLANGLFYFFALGEDRLYSKYLLINSFIVVGAILSSLPLQSLYTVPASLFLSESLLAIQFLMLKRRTLLNDTRRN